MFRFPLLNIMCVSFMHVFAYIIYLFLSLLSYIPLYDYVTWIYPFAGGWKFVVFSGFGWEDHFCPCILVYMCMHFCCVCSRSGISGSQGICILALLVAIKWFSRVVLPANLQTAVYKNFSYSISLPMLGVASPVNFNYSGGSLAISH